MLLLSSADFFQKQLFKQKSLRNTMKVSNGLGLNQDLHTVGPDLGPKSLQRLSADDKCQG